MKTRTYQDLIVWQRSIELVKEIYLLTKLFPKEELFGLVSQMRRAAVSIPSNIAEGYGRRSINEYHHFFSIAYGSVLELETQIVISRELNLINQDEFSKTESLLTEVAKMLYVMIYKKGVVEEKLNATL